MAVLMTLSDLERWDTRGPIIQHARSYRII